MRESVEDPDAGDAGAAEYAPHAGLLQSPVLLLALRGLHARRLPALAPQRLEAPHLVPVLGLVLAQSLLRDGEALLLLLHLGQSAEPVGKAVSTTTLHIQCYYINVVKM